MPTSPISARDKVRDYGTNLSSSLSSSKLPRARRVYVRARSSWQSRAPTVSGPLPALLEAAD